jgi:hypothetical protein
MVGLLLSFEAVRAMLAANVQQLLQRVRDYFFVARRGPAPSAKLRRSSVAGSSRAAQLGSMVNPLKVQQQQALGQAQAQAQQGQLFAGAGEGAASVSVGPEEPAAAAGSGSGSEGKGAAGTGLSI